MDSICTSLNGFAHGVSWSADLAGYGVMARPAQGAFLKEMGAVTEMVQLPVSSCGLDCGLENPQRPLLQRGSELTLIPDIARR